MFGNKKTKIDSKIRFQNPRFKKHLQSARGYKRSARSLPQTDWGVFLSKIGLDSWMTRIISFLILAFLIYIVYFPNLFFIKNISLGGVAEENYSSVINSTNSFLDKKLPLPQRNIFLLSKTKLSAYILKNNQKVFKVTKITKKFPSSLQIETEARINIIELHQDNDRYLVSNDGIITSHIEQLASNTLPSLPILININNIDSIIVGHRALTQDTANFIRELNNKLPNIVRSEITNFELSGLNNSDLTVYFNKNFKVLFDITLDTTQTLNRLALLFSQYSDVDISKLYYADMRFEGRSYVCKKDSPCIKDIILPNNSASTTQSNINN